MGGVAVEVLSATVVDRGDSRARVPRGDLNVAERNPGIAYRASRSAGKLVAAADEPSHRRHDPASSVRPIDERSPDAPRRRDVGHVA